MFNIWLFIVNMFRKKSAITNDVFCVFGDYQSRRFALPWELLLLFRCHQRDVTSRHIANPFLSPLGWVSDWRVNTIIRSIEWQNKHKLLMVLHVICISTTWEGLATYCTFDSRYLSIIYEYGLSLAWVAKVAG